MDKVNTHNIISSADAQEILETTVRSLLNNPEMAEQIPSIMLRGAPGVGKTTIVRDLAKKLGIEFKSVMLSQMERVDLCGLPSVEDHVTEWNVPAVWPRGNTSKGILLLDELTSAPADVQVAAYQLILERRISNADYTLPPGWYVVAAGNRAIDRAVVKTMSSALANRFMHFELEPNVEDWLAWAIPHDIHPAVTGFLKFRPSLLSKMGDQNLEQGWPSPRSWEKVSTAVKMFAYSEDILRKAVYGLIGPGAGVEFMAFYKTNKKFDDVLDMLTNPKATINIPEKSDEKCALGAAVSYLLWNGKSDADDVSRVEGMYRIVDQLTPDFAVMIVKNAMLGNSRVSKIDAIKKIMSSTGYKLFAEKHAKAFAERHSL